MSDDAERPQRPYRGPGRAAPYALSRLSGPVSLTDVAREIEQADQWIASTTGAQLHVIAEQIAALRHKAELLLEQARTNAELHRAEARFKRTPGKVYHLYADGERKYWSMLSPEDWGGAPPHEYVGSFRLEADQSWTPLSEVRERDARQSELAEWLEPKLLPDR
jgi:hypothetical protein